MTLRRDDFPAPFGPMMARISCSRTSKDTACSATTPPKESEMPSTSRIGPPTVLPTAVSQGRGSGGLAARGDAESPCVHDRQVRRDRSRAAVLEAHLRFEEAVIRLRVERVDQRPVFLPD